MSARKHAETLKPTDYQCTACAGYCMAACACCPPAACLYCGGELVRLFQRQPDMRWIEVEPEPSPQLDLFA